MCAYSAMIDNVTHPYMAVGPISGWPGSILRREMNEMRDQFQREINALRELLPHVQKYDQDTGQFDCESDEKLVLLRQIADKLGVDVKGIA